MTLRFCLLVLGVALAGCSDVDWQGTFDRWAESACLEEGYLCDARR